MLHFQTFKPLVDNVGLFNMKGPKGAKLPVEFLADLKLDFQDCTKLRTIRVSIDLCVVFANINWLMAMTFSDLW